MPCIINNVVAAVVPTRRGGKLLRVGDQYATMGKVVSFNMLEGDMLVVNIEGEKGHFRSIERNWIKLLERI